MLKSILRFLFSGNQFSPVGMLYGLLRYLKALSEWNLIMHDINGKLLKTELTHSF